MENKLSRLYLMEIFDIMILVVTLKETYFFFYKAIFPVSMLDLQ